MESEFQRAARQRWPYANMAGDGPYALSCSTLDTVKLYPHWMQAATELVKQCGQWDCRDTHRMLELQPVYETRRPAIRNRALMEAD